MRQEHNGDYISFSPCFILNNLYGNTKWWAWENVAPNRLSPITLATENEVLGNKTKFSFVWEHLAVYCVTGHICPNFAQRKVNCGRTWHGALMMLLSVSNLGTFGTFDKCFAARILFRGFCIIWVQCPKLSDVVIMHQIYHDITLNIRTALAEHVLDFELTKDT